MIDSGVLPHPNTVPDAPLIHQPSNKSISKKTPQGLWTTVMGPDNPKLGPLLDRTGATVPLLGPRGPHVLLLSFKPQASLADCPEELPVSQHWFPVEP